MSGGLTWSSKTGLHWTGQATLSLDIPLHASIGPLTIQELRLAIEAGTSDVALTAGVTASAKIGPVEAAVTDFGVKLALASMTAPARGTFGDLDLDFGFKPPSGIGLSIDAQGVISGGGFSVPRRGAGALRRGDAAVARRAFTLKAFGLIATRMPDGSRGYSLIVFITAEDFRPIPLGMGFTLLGIGGMVAINRTFDEDVLREGLKNDTLKTLLFPRDPVGNAPAIIRALASAFPARRGSYLLGMLARIGWFTPDADHARPGADPRVRRAPAPARARAHQRAAALARQRSGAPQPRLRSACSTSTRAPPRSTPCWSTRGWRTSSSLTGAMALRARWSSGPHRASCWRWAASTRASRRPPACRRCRASPSRCARATTRA